MFAMITGMAKIKGSETQKKREKLNVLQNSQAIQLQSSFLFLRRSNKERMLMAM